MLVEDEIISSGKFKLSGEHLKIVEQEREKHVKKKGKSYNWNEAGQIIRSRNPIRNTSEK